MGDLTKHFEKNEEIKRSKSFVNSMTGLNMEMDDLKEEDRISVGQVKKKAKASEDKTKKQGKASPKGNRIGDLKNAAGSINSVRPAKPLTKEQKKAQVEQERRTVADQLAAYHRTLEAEERKAFDRKGIDRIKRKKYSSFWGTDLSKRVTSAISRRENAAAIVEAEKKLAEIKSEDSVLDKEDFEQKLRGFMNLDIPYKMTKDADFVKNLLKNYQLYDQARQMRKWIDDAVEGDYFPAEVDLAEAQAKINSIFDMKEYLDVQKELMKNPYYQYMAKDDISYNAEQLENLKNRTKDEMLRDYLSTVQRLKGLAFVRKKGMDSVKKRSLDAGRKQAEILSTRAQKRQLTRTFSEEALIIRGNQRFRDKDYDRKYTPEVFQAALNGFKMIRVKDLHFKNVRDIAENFKENNRIFDETREFEHLLFVAVQRNNAPADEEMIRLRAKIKAIKTAEYMVTHIQNKIITDPGSFQNKTYDEFLTDCQSEIRNSVNPDETIDVPKPGMNMETYYNNILKALKRAHNDRSQEIRTAYGITHPLETAAGQGADQENEWHIGAIPDDVLRQRRADYQKNVFINDYIAELKTYSEDVYGKRAASFLAVYGRRRGRTDQSSVFNRVTSQYILGMSSEELKKVVDALAFGTDETKKELWDQIFKETRSANLTKIGTNDKDVFMNNLAWANRMANIYLNYSENKADEKQDKNAVKASGETDALYQAGCSHALLYQTLNAAVKTRWCRSMPLADWFTMDLGRQNRFNSDMIARGNNSANGRLVVDGKVIMKDEAEVMKYSEAFLSLNNLEESRKSEYNAERQKAGYVNTPYITMYEARKHFKVINDTSQEEIQRLREFYENNKGLEGYEHYEAPNDIAQKAEAIEKKFRKILSFDLSLLNYASYTDIIASAGKNSKRFKDCISITTDLMETEQFSLFQQYRELLDDNDLKGTCRLNEDQLKEIEARCAVLKSATGFFDGSFEDILNSPALADTRMSIEEVLHLSEAEINAKKRAADEAHNADASALWTRVLSFTQRLGGFDMGQDLRDFVQLRRFEKGLRGEPVERDIINILNDKTSILKDTQRGELVPVCDTEEQYLAHFASTFTERKLSVSEREENMNDTKSPLYTRHMNCENLRTAQENAVNSRVAARRKISLRSRRAAGEKSLVHLSAFMTGDQNEDEKLAAEYADKEKRFGLLDRLTKKIYETDFNARMTTDAEFVSQAAQLEKISVMAKGYNELLKENPDYLDTLRDRTNVDHAAFMSKLDAMLAFSDYYRARTLLITDSYYISHYDEELSPNHDDKSTDDQRYIADLIRLVAECSRRLRKENLTGRSYAGMDDLLDTMELKSRQRAYLFGQSDLKKAKADYSKKADNEIRRYFNKVLEDVNGEPVVDDGELIDEDFDEIDENKKKTGDLKDIIVQNHDEHPFPKEAKYETDAVKYHLAMVRNQKRTIDMKAIYDTFDEKQYDLHKDIAPILNRITEFKFTDPGKKETLFLSTKPQRVILSLIINYGKNMPKEELLEMAEGFSVIEQYKLDTKNAEDMAYAKQRWLDSAKKLFYLEYNAVKRFESTYGTLPDQLPPGNFLHSLGSSKELFFTRSYFGQDMTEITDEKKCRAGDEELSIGEYMVKEGLIKADELSDAKHLCSGFYQNVNGYYTNVIGMGVASFGRYIQDSYHHDKDTHLDQLNGRRKYEIKGPKLTFNQEKEYWQETLDQGTRTLYGSDESVEFRKHALNLYSDEERQEIREKRRNEAEIITLYENTVNARAEALIPVVKGKLGESGAKIDEDLIRKLIIFHPAMMDLNGPESIPQDQTDEFIRLLSDFAGSGVPKEEQAKKRADAYRKMTERMTAVRGSSSIKTNDPDKLIENETYSDRENINFKSRLMRTAVLERQLNAMQSMMKDEEDKSVIPEDTFRGFRDLQLRMLSNIVIKGMKKDKRYIALKDIGNRVRTLPDYEQAEVELLLANLGNADRKFKDPDEVLTDERREIIKKLYDIDIDKASVILGAKEKAPEAVNESAPKAQKIKPTEKVVSGFVDDLFREAEAEEQITEASLGLPGLPQYKEKTKLAVKYEVQDTYNCWCCSGAAIYNKFISLHDKKLKKEDFVDQFMIRGFRPGEDELRSLEQVRQVLGDQYSQKDYNDEKQKMYAFMGEGNEAYGSIIEVADFFMKKRTDFVLNRMRINLPAFNPPDRPDDNGQVQPRKTDEDRKNDVRRLYNQKVAFLNKLKEVLATDNPVSLYLAYEQHYVTITALNGETVTYMDSKTGQEDSSSVSDLLKRTDNGTTVELSWFSELKEPKDMVDENPGLLYDEATGYSVPPEMVSTEEALNLAHTRGVCISQNEGQLGQNMEGIGIIKYFPKFGNKMNKKPEKQQEKNIIKEEKREEQKNIIKEEKQQEKNIIIEEKKAGEIKADKEQIKNDASAEVIDKAEKRGSLNVLDELFADKSGFGEEYAAFLDRIMEREDFTFDEDGIKTIRNMIDDQIKDKAKAEEAKKNFDEKLAPDYRKVFKLVSDKVIGKDTAKIFLNPDAMSRHIQADKKTNYDSKIYDTFTARIAHKEQSNEDAYRAEIAELVNYYTKDAKQVSLQQNHKVLGVDKYFIEDDLKKNKTFVLFHCDKDKKKNKNEDMRCYVTVPEDKQLEMVKRLRKYMTKKGNEKFKGAFNFKLMSTQNYKKLDNIVIFYDGDKDAELMDEFIKGFGEQIKDIASKDESIPTVANIQPGIGVCAEPGEAFQQLYRQNSTYNPLCTGDLSMEGNQLLQEHTREIAKDKKKPRFLLSWDRYCARLLILSANIARHRLNKKGTDINVSKDDEMKNEIKKVFREFMIISGVDPATMKASAKKGGASSK